MPVLHCLPGVCLLAGDKSTCLSFSLLQDVQSAELQHAELEEAAAEKQCQHDQHSQAATAAAKQRQELEADVAAAQEQLKQLQQQAQVRSPVEVVRLWACCEPL